MSDEPEMSVVVRELDSGHEHCFRIDLESGEGRALQLASCAADSAAARVAFSLYRRVTLESSADLYRRRAIVGPAEAVARRAGSSFFVVPWHRPSERISSGVVEVLRSPRGS